MTTKKLTDIAIRAMKTPEKRQEIPAGSGLYLLLQPSGSKGWALRYRFGGRPQKLTLGSWFAGDIKDAPEPKIDGPLTLKGARLLAAAELHKIKAKGHDPAAAKRKAQEEQDRRRENTFRAVAERYMTLEAGMKVDDAGNPTGFNESKLRTGRERWQMLERSAFPTLGGLPISDIRKSGVIKLLDKLACGDLKDQHGHKIKGGDVAADRLLAVIRKIFSWHASREDDFRSPIVAGLNRVKGSEQARTRVLNDDELRVIYKTASALEGPFHAFIRFSLLTCSRRGEAAGMQWAEVDAAGDWELPAERNKVKVPLLRPLSQMAQDLLAKQPRTIGCEFVFSSDGKTAISGYSKHKAKFDAAVKKLHPEAAIPNWTIHDLRRTARSLMSRAGVNADHAERCLGHTIAGVRSIYDRHQYRDEKARAFEMLAAQITAIAEPTPTNVLPFPQAAGGKDARPE